MRTHTRALGKSRNFSQLINCLSITYKAESPLTRVDGIAGRGPNVGSVIFLFAEKEVFPFPLPPLSSIALGEGGNPFREKRSIFSFISLYLPVSGTEASKKQDKTQKTACVKRNKAVSPIRVDTRIKN